MARQTLLPTILGLWSLGAKTEGGRCRGRDNGVVLMCLRGKWVSGYMTTSLVSGASGKDLNLRPALYRESSSTGLSYAGS